MKKVMSLFLVAGLVFGATFVLSPEAYCEQMNVFKSTVGISVKYPESWSVRDQSEYLSDSPDSPLKVSAYFRSSKEVEPGEFAPGIILAVYDVSNNAEMTPSAKLDSLIKMNRMRAPGLEIVQSIQDMTIGSQTFKMAETEGKAPEGYEMRSLYLCIMKGQWLIYASYNATPDDFEEYKDQAMAIIESIE